MGQSRYERLPKSQNWQNVVAVLSSPKTSVAQVAGATSKACRIAIRRHSDDVVLVHAVYLLAHLPLAAKQERAQQFLAGVGIEPDALSSPSLLIDELTEFLQRQNFNNSEPSFVTEIAHSHFQETFVKLMNESNLIFFADRRDLTSHLLAPIGTPRGTAQDPRVFL